MNSISSRGRRGDSLIKRQPDGRVVVVVVVVEVVGTVGEGAISDRPAPARGSSPDSNNDVDSSINHSTTTTPDKEYNCES